MSNQSTNLRLSRAGKVMIRIQGNGIRSEKGLKIQVKKKKKHHIRSSMHLREGGDFNLRSRKRVMIGILYNVGLVT